MNVTFYTTLDNANTIHPEMTHLSMDKAETVITYLKFFQIIYCPTLPNLANANIP